MRKNQILLSFLFFLLAFTSFFISQIIPHYSTWFCPYCLPQLSPVLVSFTPEDPTLDSHSASDSAPCPRYMFSPRSTAHMPGGPALSESRLQTLRAGTIDLLPSRIFRRQNGDISDLMVSDGKWFWYPLEL